MNLDWSLAGVSRLMHPPKGPVSKQKPRRQDRRPYDIHTVLEESREQQESGGPAGCTQKGTDSSYYLTMTFTLKQSSTYFPFKGIGMPEVVERLCV